MIDIFTVVLPHALMALAVWRLLHNDALDNDPALPQRKVPVRKQRARAQSRADEAGAPPRA